MGHGRSPTGYICALIILIKLGMYAMCILGWGVVCVNEFYPVVSSAGFCVSINISVIY